MEQMPNFWKMEGMISIILFLNLIFVFYWMIFAKQNIADMQKYEMSRRQVFGTRKIITGGQSRCGHRDTRAQLPPQALTTRLKLPTIYHYPVSLALTTRLLQ